MPHLSKTIFQFLVSVKDQGITAKMAHVTFLHPVNDTVNVQILMSLGMTAEYQKVRLSWNENRKTNYICSQCEGLITEINDNAFIVCNRSTQDSEMKSGASESACIS